QVAHLGVGPYKGALDIGQPDVADIQIVQQVGQVVVHALEAGFHITHRARSFRNRSASATRSSPEISFGSSVSRRSTRSAHSLSFSFCALRIGMACWSKASISFVE